MRIINCKVEPMTAIIRAYESPSSSSSDIRNRRQSPRRLGWHLIAGGLAGTYCVESKANERKACRPREGRGIEWDFGSWHYPTDMTWYMHRHWTEFGTRTSPKSLPGPLPPPCANAGQSLGHVRPLTHPSHLLFAATWLAIYPTTLLHTIQSPDDIYYVPISLNFKQKNLCFFFINNFMFLSWAQIELVCIYELFVLELATI